MLHWAKDLTQDAEQADDEDDDAGVSVIGDGDDDVLAVCI